MLITRQRAGSQALTNHRLLVNISMLTSTQTTGSQKTITKKAAIEGLTNESYGLQDQTWPERVITNLLTNLSTHV
jgi:hypothetical protein